MKMKNVTIIGVGALGSHVVQFLRNEASLKVIDFDRVEQKNVLSQFHGKPGVGKAKTEALKQAMQFLFALKIEPLGVKLTKDNDTQLLSGSDLLIDCLDNGASRRVVQAFARRTNTPCLHGALDAAGTFGRVIWDENFQIDDEAGTGAATCEDGAHLPFIVSVSAHIALAAQDFLAKATKVGYSIPRGGGAIRV